MKMVQDSESSGTKVSRIFLIFPKKKPQKKVFPLFSLYFPKKISAKKFLKIVFQQLCPQKKFFMYLHHSSSSNEEKISCKNHPKTKGHWTFQKFFLGFPGFHSSTSEPWDGWISQKISLENIWFFFCGWIWQRFRVLIDLQIYFSSIDCEKFKRISLMDNCGMYIDCETFERNSFSNWNPSKIERDMRILFPIIQFSMER